jgi:hypothetical protein
LAFFCENSYIEFFRNSIKFKHRFLQFILRLGCYYEFSAKVVFWS